jgi:hypothetical protein
MEKYKPEQQGEKFDEKLHDLAHKLSEVTDEEIPIEYVDGTYEIETSSFTLTFTIEEEIFEIRNIDVHGNTGLGSQIVTAVHCYADENGFEVIASNVLDTARGFWENIGYQESESEDEFFRVE